MEDEIESGVNAVDKDLSCHLPRAASFNERGLQASGPSHREGNPIVSDFYSLDLKCVDVRCVNRQRTG